MNTLTLELPQVNRYELETKVKEMYGKVALQPNVPYHFEMGRALAGRLGYPKAILDQIPSQSIDSFAGVGYYFDLADLKPGEAVVDLGSGSGMDVFFARHQVGPTGEVIGIDMTSEQLTKSKNLNKYPDNVFFIESYIEELSIRSHSMDVVISNGVINLSSEKYKVFEEAARVLKPGGRLAIADIITTFPLPEKISCNANLWASCIGGAMQINEYSNLIEQSGLKIVAVKENNYSFLSNGARIATHDYGIKSVSLLAIKK